MNNGFDLQQHLDAVYARFPEADRQPVIGITGNYEDLTCKLGQGYYQSVVAAGGVPLIIPPVADTDTIVNTLSRIDGLILSGGGDFNPLWTGEEPSTKLGGINKERDLPELLITRLAYNRQIPMLGICRGIQTLAIALGGEVAQDADLYHFTVPEPVALDRRSLATSGTQEGLSALLFECQFLPPSGREGTGLEVPCGGYGHRWHHRGDREYRVQVNSRCAVASRVPGDRPAPVPVAGG